MRQTPLDIIRIYGLRFKIERSFEQALRVVGAYAYHFWMAAMTPISLEWRPVSPPQDGRVPRRDPRESDWSRDDHLLRTRYSQV